MKSYKVVEFGQPLQKVEAANPAPQGTEVVVRITAAGVCHSDVHLWEGFFDMGGGNKYSTAKTMNPPRIMGHEIVGVDLKSTRLYSSHPSISYSVFCLKKKKVY